MKIRFKKLQTDIETPVYAHAGDSGFDIRSAETITIAPGERASLSTGLAFELPVGYGAFVWARSGLSHKQGLQTIGGCIDSGYRGEYKIGLVNLSDTAYEIKKGEKIANIVIQRIETATFEETSELSDTIRGEGGFGSTGTH